MSTQKKDLPVSLELTQHFIRGLSRLGLTFDDMKDYKYCGGDSGSHLNYWRDHINKNNKYNKPANVSNCICGHSISENCYIMHKTNSRILVLGNCCIQKFVSDCGRTCENCGSGHQNRKVNRCNNCRIGKCDKCDRQCNPKYKVCYNCRFPAEEKKTNACLKCKKVIDSKYKYCYTCNSK